MPEPKFNVVLKKPNSPPEPLPDKTRLTRREAEELVLIRNSMRTEEHEKMGWIYEIQEIPQRVSRKSLYGPPQQKPLSRRR